MRPPIKEDNWLPPDELVPANLHAEKAILGSIFLDNKDLPCIASILGADDFSLDSHRRIFLRMTELFNEGCTVDIVTLAERLAFHNERETIGGVAYLASLTEDLPRCPVQKDYICIVKEKRHLRVIIGQCLEAISKAMEQSTTASDIVKNLGIGLKGIKKSNQEILCPKVQ